MAFPYKDILPYFTADVNENIKIFFGWGKMLSNPTLEGIIHIFVIPSGTFGTFNVCFITKPGQAIMAPLRH